MEEHLYPLEPKTRFSESIIWQLNREFYQEQGIGAWSADIVPHHMTSNAAVGRTYAELIFGLLKDIASKGNTTDTVYLLELGAGHGRLGFHILKHLDHLLESLSISTPPYCYVLSDIVEENLTFFEEHPQLQPYYERGVLDVAYFDAIGGRHLDLLKANKSIQPNELKQPIVAIANYFFDSIPNDLFLVQNHELFDCSIAVHSTVDPVKEGSAAGFQNMQVSYHAADIDLPMYEDQAFNDILQGYKVFDHPTYVFFPKKGMECLSNLKSISKEGMVLLTMDKGFHEWDNLKNRKEPDLVTHGSFSLWVNYHALSAYCTNDGGRAMFPSNSNFHLEIGCLMFLEDNDSYPQMNQAYEEYVDQFGPDDFNTIKQLAYSNLSRLRLKELLALYRLSGYDSTIFVKLLPRLKQVIKTITVNERRRLSQVMAEVWDMYFNINESLDLSYEIGGLFYDLGFYTEALDYFQHSIDTFGDKADVNYNQALCYYQLRQDQNFYTTMNKAQLAFPESTAIQSLAKLDMGS